jgi:hypothetical protein
MKPSREADVIVQHAFESDRNLQIAVKVGLAFTSIKERIEKEFIEQLISTLKFRLAEWQGQEWDVEDKWSECWYIAAWKPQQWGDNASIGLAYESAGPRNLHLFVWCNSAGSKSISTSLKQALEERYPYWRHNDECPWWTYVERPDHPYRDWTSEDALMRLWKKDEAVEYYATHLLTICQIASPSVDKFCEK